MDISVIIILAVVCMAIGFVLDNLLHSLRGNQSMGGTPSKVGATAGAKGEVVEPVPPESSPPPAVTTPPLAEVLRIWRRKVEQDLVVEVSGKQAHLPAELDRDQLDRLGAILQEMSTWLGQRVSPAAPETGASVSVSLPEGFPGLLSQTESTNEFLLAEVNRPSLHPIQALANALRAEIRKPPGAEARSIAAQVDDVLQEKLKGSPLEKRGIHLLDSPDPGLLVQVGLEKFSGVEEVPDEEIRALIRQAVTEWGEKTLPGK